MLIAYSTTLEFESVSIAAHSVIAKQAYFAPLPMSRMVFESSAALLVATASTKMTFCPRTNQV